ncbi:fibronectin type III domain-containing protein [Luteolibacter sp. SL250]|uniref:endo-beta-N-acetylglucosaminidase n=1 Tax=Luteolibacter sp. SL250 TaxID=2995170 RepID=UPI00226F00CE|nr:fibronectin type III domain-containing protein [Luteolibacter sp. SL250]WAC18300.1 fibronectin type III domain-containing protein [Luteolibacter sp. SL250]
MPASSSSNPCPAGKSLALSLALLLSGNLSSTAQYEFTPAAPQWNPTEILNWSPETDPNAPYNRSVVPLAARFTAPRVSENPALNSLWNVNPHARPGEARVQSITTFNTIPVASPSGFRTYRLFAPSMWQYTDDMVFWGSSDRDTKTILTPTAHTIDAAHRNGVRIYGKIFYGWNGSPDNAALQRVRDLLVKDGSTFPVADKLIEAAVYYGFDGWFINQENYQTNETDAQNMRDFIQYFRAKATAVGASHLRFVWYDAMAENGSRSFQNAYTTSNDGYLRTPTGDRVSDAMFLNFWWYNNANGLPNSRSLALSQGVSPYDLYAGIWTENYRKLGVTPDPNGANELDITWSYLFPEGQPHNTSVGIYGGETPFFKGMLNDGGPTRVNQQEELYWSGPNGDPTNTATTATYPNWNGFAHYIPANSAVTTLPFVTNFNAGQGVRYHIDGTPSMAGQWTNLSVQDLLPTWRWIVTTPGAKSITPVIDYAEAYYGGSSLKVSGSLAAEVPQEVKLYQTQLSVQANTSLRFIHKSSAASDAKIEIGLAFEDAPTTMVYSTAGLATDTSWTTTDFPLSAYAGKKIVLITARYSSPSAIASYTSNLGRIQISNGATSTPSAPSTLALEGQAVNPDEGTSTQLRLKWTHSPTAVLVYNVYYRRNLNPESASERVWIGATANNHFFAQDVRRIREENAGFIEVEAVAPDYGVSPAITLPFTFSELPNLDHPVIDQYPLRLPILASTEKANNIQAFDYLPATTIEPGGADNAWVGLDLGTAKQISAVRFIPRNDHSDRMIRGVFQGSNSPDFSSPEKLAEINIRPVKGAEAMLAVTHPGTFRYVRYLSPNGGYANVAELKFYAAGPPLPTAPPVNVQGRISGTNAVVYWNPPYAGYATGYNLKRSTTDGGPYTTIASNIAEPTFRDTGLTSGTTYYYVVSTISGKGESVDSAQIILNPPAVQKLPGTLISGGVTANGANVLGNIVDNKLNTYFQATAISGWVGLDLGSPQAINCIRITPMNNNSSPMLAGCVQGANNADFSDAVTFAMFDSGPNYNILTSIATNPSAGTYRYVRYLSSDLRTPTIAELEFYGGTLPGAPAGLTANARDTGAALTWETVAGATRYKVKRSTNPGGPYLTLDSNVTGLDFADTGLTAGTTYHYVVSAMNAVGEGNHSAEASTADQYFKWLTESGLAGSTGFNQESGGIPAGVRYMNPDGLRISQGPGQISLSSVIRHDPNVTPTLWSSPDLVVWTEIPFAGSADQTDVSPGFRRIEAQGHPVSGETKWFYRMKFSR